MSVRNELCTSLLKRADHHIDNLHREVDEGRVKANAEPVFMRVVKLIRGMKETVREADEITATDHCAIWDAMDAAVDQVDTFAESDLLGH